MKFMPKTRDGLRILYHANAPWAKTGYGVQSNSLLPRLAQMDEVEEIALLAYYGIAGGESMQEIGFETPEFQLARWIACADRKKLDDFVQANYSSVAEDLDGDRVFMARNQFILDYTRERSAGMVFTDIKDVKNRDAVLA